MLITWLDCSLTATFAITFFGLNHIADLLMFLNEPQLYGSQNQVLVASC